MITIHQAILSLEPNAGFILQDDDIDTLVWTKDDVTQPSNEDILAEQTRLQAEYDAKDWERNRLEQYPSLQDCIHALLDGGDTLTDLQAARQLVKDTYPKPGE
jgi:hypothetical protein